MNFNKKAVKKTDRSFVIISIIGILILVNFFSYQLFYRWDLTQNKDYSISAVSKKTVRNLDDVVNIKVYFSKSLPSQFIGLKQGVGDILDEYANYSSGNIRPEFISPDNDEDIKMELYQMGIPELQFEVYEKDKLQLVKGYMGMAVQYGGKQEVIPVIRSAENLEYQITLAIKKVTSEEMGAIGFVSNYGTINLSEESQIVFKEIQKIYDTSDIDLSAVDAISPDIKTLVIVGPTEEFSEDDLKKIDDFVMAGGSLLVLVDGVKVENGLVAKANKTGLNNLLENYGVKINSNLVLDVSSGMASFNQGFFTFTSNYPFWPKIIKEGFDQNSAIVAKLENVVMPWSSSLEILEDKIDKESRVFRLVQTTPKAWEQTDNFNLNPQQQFNPGSRGKKVLAALISGRFSSPYSDKSVDSARLIVVGDSDFIKDRIAPRNSDNLVFFQNLVDGLSLDEDLINIRSKAISDRPIKELSDGQKATVRYANVFGLTILVVAFGLFRYFLRRKNRFVDEL